MVIIGFSVLFSIHGHGGHLGHIAWAKYCVISFSLCPKAAYEISPVVSKKKSFENVDRKQMSDFWPRSLHNLDVLSSDELKSAVFQYDTAHSQQRFLRFSQSKT